MSRRLALLTACALVLSPAALRPLLAPRASGAACAPVGRGRAPREWIGCGTDEGPARGLSGRERVLFGLPVDLNAASTADLAAVPGLSPKLADAIVQERSVGGHFEAVDDLVRVRGIGPNRLERARPYLAARQ